MASPTLWERKLIYLAGTGSCMPNKSRSARETAELIDGVDEGWILEKTGIKRVFLASPGENASDFAYRAACEAIETSGLAPKDIDLIVVASFSQDYSFPPLSAKLHQMLGIQGGQVLDINTNCTGFVAATTLAAERLMMSNQANSALVVATELQSRFINPCDRDTSIFFSDGAGAAVLSKQKSGHQYVGSSFYTDSSNFESVRMRAGGSAVLGADDITFIEQNGIATWRQAITNLPKTIRNLFQDTDQILGPEVQFIFHQANFNLIEFVMSRLKVPMENTFTNVCEVGNSGAASIPICLHEAIGSGWLERERPLVLAGVGAGFNFGASFWRGIE